MKIVIKKSNRKTISIKFVTNKELVVFAPIYASKKDIDKFIESKKTWILKKGRELDLHANYLKDVIEFKKGMLFGEFVDYTKNFKNEYTKLANEFLPKRVEQIAKYYGFDYNFVTVKEFTARWGSCTSKKEIQLNTRLIMLKKRVIDYVIVHELCHTLYMNHQKGFKDKLASYFVDEKAIKAYLKKHSYLTRIDY